MQVWQPASFSLTPLVRSKQPLPEEKITKITARVANLLSVCATSCCFYLIFSKICWNPIAAVAPSPWSYVRRNTPRGICGVRLPPLRDGPRKGAASNHLLERPSSKRKRRSNCCAGHLEKLQALEKREVQSCRLTNNVVRVPTESNSLDGKNSRIQRRGQSRRSAQIVRERVAVESSECYLRDALSLT